MHMSPLGAHSIGKERCNAQEPTIAHFERGVEPSAITALVLRVDVKTLNPAVTDL